jgi:hypothetical protein
VLVEVSVPYTDAYQDPSFASVVIYRLYYETTHWVDKLVWDGTGNAWYRFYDDKRQVSYYAPATHLRVVTDGEIAPISPSVDSNKKLLTVNVTEEVVTAFEDNKPVFMTRCSTGRRSYSIFRTTPLGWHITNHKRLTRHRLPATWLAPRLRPAGYPWVVLHPGGCLRSAYWHNDFSTPQLDVSTLRRRRQMGAALVRPPFPRPAICPQGLRTPSTS